MAIKNASLNRLQNYFSIGIKPNAELPSDLVFPLRKDRTDANGKEVFRNIKQKFSQESEDLFKYWLNSTYQPGKSWQNREALWDDMDVLYFNAQVISKAIELIADETIQADSNDQLIFIDAKRPVKKYIQKFFDDININSLLRPTVIDVEQYGNAIWILGFDDKGVNEVIPKCIRALKDRLEFSPYQVKQEIQKKESIVTQFNKISRMQSLIDSMMDKEETTSYFKKYLFGFQIEDKVLPPWKCIHFRNMTTKSPFDPFGIPLFIHSMSAYKQYDAAMTLINAARVAAFPKQVISINIPNQMDPATKIEKAMEAMAEWFNEGFGQSKKELPGLGDVLFVIKDLFEFQDVKVDVDLGDMGDLDKLWEALVTSTFLPRYMVDSKDTGFGDSGVALIQKSVPFARLVYRMQSILLENITQLVKIQMLYTGDFSVEETKFTLSMKYPESQINQDLVASQNAMFDLVNNIINAIQDKVTGGELLPPELIKTIWTQFLPYDSQRVEAWIDDAIKAKGDDETVETVDSVSNQQQIDQLKNPPVEGQDEQLQYEAINKKRIIKESIKARNFWRLLEKQQGKIALKETVDNIVFEEKYDFVRESVIRGRHVYSSRNRDQYFAAEQLRDFDRDSLKKFAEQLTNEKDRRTNSKEEIEYVFTFASQDKELEEKMKKKNKRNKRR